MAARRLNFTITRKAETVAKADAVVKTEVAAKTDAVELPAAQPAPMGKCDWCGMSCPDDDLLHLEHCHPSCGLCVECEGQLNYLAGDENPSQPTKAGKAYWLVEGLLLDADRAKRDPHPDAKHLELRYELEEKPPSPRSPCFGLPEPTREPEVSQVRSYFPVSTMMLAAAQPGGWLNEDNFFTLALMAMKASEYRRSWCFSGNARRDVISARIIPDVRSSCWRGNVGQTGESSETE